MQLEFSQQIFEKYWNIKFPENRPVGDKLSHADERTNEGIDMTKLIVAFRNFAEVSKNESSWNPNYVTMQHDQHQHNRPASSVIAQQYSSAMYSHCLSLP